MVRKREIGAAALPAAARGKRLYMLVALWAAGLCAGSVAVPTEYWCCCCLPSCRAGVRSEARYIVSFEPEVTAGTGFVGSLSLIAKVGEPQSSQLQYKPLEEQRLLVRQLE
jgi:hypothetical protein